MFCGKCGNPVNENDKFCSVCGNVLKAQTPVQVQTPSEPQQSADAEMQQKQSVVFEQYVETEKDVLLTKSKKKSKNRLVLCLVSILLIVAISLTAVFGGSLFNNGSSVFGGSTSEEKSNATQSKAVCTRTVMIYIVGSDLESCYGAASEDIKEMIDSGFDTEKTNVLIYTGGADDWDNSKISSDSNGIFIVENDDITPLDESTAENMGKSETLSEFINYSKENYPADKFGLILWNHGGGPMLGYGIDEIHNDLLDLSELEDALEDSAFSSEEKLEFLGFDACLMGSIETSWVFKDYAEYFVGSQEVEPGAGWDYSFLKEIDTCADGGEIGTKIVEYYFDYYEQLFDENPSYETELSLSCLDLSKIDEVEDGINNLFENVDAELLEGEISFASRCRYSAKSFGKFTSNVSYDLIDLVHITDLLSDNYSDETQELKDALDEFIVYSDSNVSNVNGVSIYHPYDNLAYSSSWISQFKGLDFAEEYADYIDDFVGCVQDQASSSSSYYDFSSVRGIAKNNGQKSDLSITLTPEQMKSFSGAEYYIFKKLPADKTFSKQEEYLHIFSGQDPVLSEDGTLSATYEGKAVFGKNSATGDVSTMPLALFQIYDGTGDEKFYFPCMFWHFGEDLDMELEPVNWLMKIKDGKPSLAGAYSIDAETSDMFPDKYLIDSNDYDVYTFSNNSYTTKTDGNGKLEFVVTGSSYGFEYSKEEGFSLEFLPIEDKSDYYAVFAIEDIYGNCYYSDFFELK